VKPLQARTLSNLPVFPLPDYHLFPGSVTPLHIFETRYRQMMHDLMDGPGRLVMAPYDPAGPRVEQGPALPAQGTLVELLRTEELEDGRWVILLLALSRVAINEVDSDRLYRRVDARILGEPEVDEAVAATLRVRLLAALQVRADGDWSEMPDEAPVGHMADVLLHALGLDPQRRAEAYAETDPVARAEMALLWHEQKPEQEETAEDPLDDFDQDDGQDDGSEDDESAS
jgi:Lon protease-like protein